MRPLTHAEFRARAQGAYKAIFASDDPYDEPFQSNIHPRLLLYGFRYGLHDPWLKPICEAVELLGEDGFFLSVLNKVGKEPWHWYIPLSEAALYASKIFPLENAIYSVHGKWGIICSDEDHALVGGPELLISNIRDSVLDLEDRVLDFLKVWKHYHARNKVDIHWLPRMLAHVYGVEKARSLLYQTQLEWLLFDRR